MLGRLHQDEEARTNNKADLSGDKQFPKWGSHPSADLGEQEPQAIKAQRFLGKVTTSGR